MKKCLNPIYRLPVSTVEKAELPPFLRNREHNGGILMSFDDMSFAVRKYGFSVSDFQTLPCGKCENCRRNYSFEWATRCVFESYTSRNAWFVTLTYNDDWLPWHSWTSFDGEIQRHPTLVKSHYQSFFKFLRKHNGDNIRYFGCGEYGEHTHRPHYHFIIFNLDLPDLRLERVDKGIPFYTSEIIGREWTKGFHLVAPATLETMLYTASYCAKKLRSYGGDMPFWMNDVYMCLDPARSSFFSDIQALGLIQEPFSAMSRRPGIGAEFIKAHSEDYVNDEKFYHAFARRCMTHFRYADKLLDPLSLAVLKGKRERHNTFRDFDSLLDSRISFDNVRNNVVVSHKFKV